MWPGLRQRLPSPAGWALLTLATQDAGKCVAEGTGQHLPVFCWELPPGHVAWSSSACLAAAYLFLQRGGSLGRWEEAPGSKVGGSGEANSSQPNSKSKLSVPGQRGTMGQVAATLAVRLTSSPQQPPGCARPLERGGTAKATDASEKGRPCRGARSLLLQRPFFLQVKTVSGDATGEGE